QWRCRARSGSAMVGGDLYGARHYGDLRGFATGGHPMEFKLFDADNHYYEAEDAFTRYGDERVKRYVRWVTEGKRRHIMFGNRVSTGVPNPTFNPIARPGAFHERLMELQDGKGE